MQWFVAYTGAQSEDLAAESLARIGEVFNPKILAKKIIKPLFPRYVLFAPSDLRAAYRARGVSRIIGYPGPPRTLNPDVVAELRTRCDAQGFYIDDHHVDAPSIKRGDFCKVTEGPFAGLQGLCRRTEQQRIILLLSLFGKSTEVSVVRQSVALV